MLKPVKIMQPGVTPLIKQRVIEDWFQGLQRDNIADKHGIGTGTVTNVIREWVADLKDGDVADAMRYFAVAFRKLKLTIPQCALGARSGIMMNKLGIEENDFDEFISGTYKFLRELGVNPRKMAYCVKQMQDLAATMPISQIPQFISKLNAQKKQLSEEIEHLRTKELGKKADVYILKEEAKDLGYELQQFENIKLKLEKYGLKINDLESFAQTVKQAQELGYDAQLICSKLAYWDELQKKQTDLELSILELKGKKANLEHKRNPSETLSNLDTIDYSISET